MKTVKASAPEELYLLVNPSTGELADTVLYSLLAKYHAPGFVPVRYVLFRKRRRLSRAGERSTAGTIERRCNKCRGWQPRERMRRAKGCAYGVSNECRLCYRERKNLSRAALKGKLVRRANLT